MVQLHICGLGLFPSAHLVIKKALFKVQICHMLLKTIAHKWQWRPQNLYVLKNPELLKIQALRCGACP